MAHHIAECKVDGCSKEGGRECDAADANEEAIEGEGVVPGYEAADVADYFGSAATDHGAEEVGLAGNGALGDMCNAREREEGEKGGVGSKGGAVVHYGISDVAVREITGVEVGHDDGCWYWLLGGG